MVEAKRDRPRDVVLTEAEVDLLDRLDALACDWATALQTAPSETAFAALDLLVGASTALREATPRELAAGRTWAQDTVRAHWGGERFAGVVKGKTFAKSKRDRAILHYVTTLTDRRGAKYLYAPAAAHLLERCEHFAAQIEAPGSNPRPGLEFGLGLLIAIDMTFPVLRARVGDDLSPISIGRINRLYEDEVDATDGPIATNKLALIRLVRKALQACGMTATESRSVFRAQEKLENDARKVERAGRRKRA